MIKKKLRWCVVLMTLLAVPYVTSSFAGQLEPPAGTPGPTMHTLEEIFRLVQNMNTRSCSIFGLRFCMQGDGTVLDTVTGLTWTQDWACLGQANWYEATARVASLADGQCGLSDGSNQGDWRIPTKDEWLATVDGNWGQPPLDPTWQSAFTNFPEAQKSDPYWSSTTGAYLPNDAWFVHFVNGTVYGSLKSNNLYVRAVRGGQ